MIEDYINIKELVEKTNESMNITYAHLLKRITESSNKYCGLIPTLYEIEMLEVGEQMCPILELFHPDNDCELGDIYSLIINDGIEVKVCTGTKVIHNGYESVNVKWRNSTIQSHTKKFLFVDIRIENCKIVIKRIFFGEFSYKEWIINKYDNDMYIGPKKLKELCERGLCKQIM